MVAWAGAVPELVLILALFFIPESPRWLVQQSCYFHYCRRQDTSVLVFTPIYLCTRLGWNNEAILILLTFIPFGGQAKAGKKEELTACLQRLRGVDYNIASEIADMQVCICSLQIYKYQTIFCVMSNKFFLCNFNDLVHMQAAMEASNALPSVKLVDLKQPKLFRPLVVSRSFNCSL